VKVTGRKQEPSISATKEHTRLLLYMLKVVVQSKVNPIQNHKKKVIRHKAACLSKQKVAIRRLLCQGGANWEPRLYKRLPGMLLALRQLGNHKP